MTNKVTVTTYERNELYTYKEASAVVGVSYDLIAVATRTGVLTKTSLPHGYGNNKFVLKSEVDAIAGLKEVTSKKARALIEASRSKNAVDSGSLDNHTPEYIDSVVNSILNTKYGGLEKKIDMLLRHFGVIGGVAT